MFDLYLRFIDYLLIYIFSDNGALLRPVHWGPQHLPSSRTAEVGAPTERPSLTAWLINMVCRDDSDVLCITSNSSGRKTSSDGQVVQCNGTKHKQAVDAALLDVRAANLILVLLFTLLMGLGNYFSSRLAV